MLPWQHYVTLICMENTVTCKSIRTPSFFCIIVMLIYFEMDKIGHQSTLNNPWCQSENIILESSAHLLNITNQITRLLKCSVFFQGKSLHALHTWIWADPFKLCKIGWVCEPPSSCLSADLLWGLSLSFGSAPQGQ